MGARHIEAVKRDRYGLELPAWKHEPGFSPDGSFEVLLGIKKETPPPTEWRMVTEVSMTNPEYLRARRVCLDRLDRWFKRKYPKIQSRNHNKRLAYAARRHFWSHVLADYILWCRVDDSQKPSHWPKSSVPFIAEHGLTLGDLSLLLARIKFKLVFEALYPPLPTYLFISKLDNRIMRTLMNDEKWDGAKANIAAMKSLSELAYKRFGILDSGKGGGVHIVNQNVNQQSTQDAMNEVPPEVLRESLRLVAPYLTNEERDVVGLPPIEEAKVLPETD